MTSTVACIGRETVLRTLPLWAHRRCGAEALHRRCLREEPGGGGSGSRSWFDEPPRLDSERAGRGPRAALALVLLTLLHSLEAWHVARPAQWRVGTQPSTLRVGARNFAEDPVFRTLSLLKDVCARGARHNVPILPLSVATHSMPSLRVLVEAHEASSGQTS